MNFTRSGFENEIRTIRYDVNKIYKHTPLPKAYSAKDKNFDIAIRIAKAKGLNAIWVDEGVNQPNSVFIITPMNFIREHPDTIHLK